MSNLIGGAHPFAQLTPKDMRFVAVDYGARQMMDRTCGRGSTPNGQVGFVTDYWPGGGGFSGDNATDFGIEVAVWSRRLGRLGYGAASRVGFSGVARDQYGAPLAGVTCSLFRVSGREWIQDFTSTSDGTFTLVSWYSPDTHFIVFYKAGSPNVYGTSDQNLVGA